MVSSTGSCRLTEGILQIDSFAPQGIEDTGVVFFGPAVGFRGEFAGHESRGLQQPSRAVTSPQDEGHIWTSQGDFRPSQRGYQRPMAKRKQSKNALSEIQNTQATDSEFLQNVPFDKSAPRALVKAAQRGNVDQFVITSRAKLEPVAARFRKNVTGSLALLSVHGAKPSPTSLSALAVHRSGGRVDADSLSQWAQTAASLGIANDCDRLLAFEMLLNPPVEIETATWCQIWRLLLVGNHGKQTSLKPGCSIAGLIANLELPLLHGLFFPVEGSEKFVPDAVQGLQNELLEMTDTDGTPIAHRVREFGDWFAVLVRAAWFCRAFRVKAFEGDSQARFEQLVARAIELCRGDAAFAFQPNDAGVPGQLLPLAARIAGLSKKHLAGKVARDLDGASTANRLEGETPAVQSDWAETAWLRDRFWQRRGRADAVVVTHDEPDLTCEVTCRGEALLSGVVTTSTRLDNKVVSRGRSEWSCTCWQSDEDGDYLELQRRFSGVQIDRQFFLSRDQHFALLSENVVAKTADAKLHHTLEFPTAPHVVARADFVTREWRLHAKGVATRVLPVSLESDRILSALGELDINDQGLRYTLSGVGAVSLSLILDWHPQRSESPADWAKLTVTESREALSSSRASAFRARIGDHQIVSYRRLDDSEELRTVLGQHMGHETLLGRMNEHGRVDPFILVEGF